MHLNASLYHLTQRIVHGNYYNSLRILEELLELKQNDTVVELGCGDGILASYFIDRGYRYYGIDVDIERIKKAQKIAGGHFFASDLLQFDFSNIPPSTKFFCYGVLHHLSDNQCIQLLNKITSLRKDIRFAIIEPVRPSTWQSNPFSSIVFRFDDGKYIRTLESWKKICNPFLKKVELKKLSARWPIDIIIALLSLD